MPDDRQGQLKETNGRNSLVSWCFTSTDTSFGSLRIMEEGEWGVGLCGRGYLYTVTAPLSVSADYDQNNRYSGGSDMLSKFAVLTVVGNKQSHTDSAPQKRLLRKTPSATRQPVLL